MYLGIYHRAKTGSTNLTGSTEGRRECVSIETKIRNILNNGEKIDATSPIIYTEKKDGVHAEHDIRTDRFEIAIDGADKANAAYNAARQNKPETGSKEQPETKKEYNTPTTETTETTQKTK